MALFALGNSYQDIRGHIAELYDIELSNGTLNAVTDKLLPELQAWRERDLEAIYPNKVSPGSYRATPDCVVIATIKRTVNRLIVARKQ